MRSRVAKKEKKAHKKAHKKAIRKPNASSVVGQTTEYKRLLQVVADAESDKADASFAVHLLSDDWASRAASFGGSNSPMLQVRSIPSDERETYSNLAKAEIVRLESIIDVTKGAAFDVSVSVYKRLGYVRHLRWLSSIGRISTRRTEDYQRWLPPVGASDPEESDDVADLRSFVSSITV
jgi:hypothetical protein